MSSNLNHALQFAHDWQMQAFATPEQATQDVTEGVAENDDTGKSRFILNRLFQHYPVSFAVRLWNGSMLYIGKESPAFTLCLEQASVLRDMVLFSDPARLAEAYFSGEVQILGDFDAAMQLRYYFESLSLPLTEKLGLVYRALTLADSQTAPVTTQTAATHQRQPDDSNTTNTLDYHAPSDFYKLWLDDKMLHSCAYFCDSTQDLAQAQHNQLDLICLKLHLQHGDTLLDIDGGWGGLACWAARHYGVFVHCLTRSPQQHAYAMAEVQKQGLEKLVTVKLCHYSDLADTPRYDKVVSIGLASLIGEQNLPDYLAKVHAVLKPGGLFLAHQVTTESPGRQHELATRFINQQVFPDGELTSLPHIRQQMQSARLEVFDVEGLRRHHALTLRRWVSKLEQRHQEIAASFGERTYRIWRLYMTASAIQFEQGVTGIHQIIAVRR
jgi:cyclopropane-fatty-acyl-phospholipid synthase